MGISFGRIKGPAGYDSLMAHIQLEDKVILWAFGMERGNFLKSCLMSWHLCKDKVEWSARINLLEASWCGSFLILILAPNSNLENHHRKFRTHQVVDEKPILGVILTDLHELFDR